MATNNLINKIRKWPIEKKRLLSLSLAIFFTVLVIVLNSGLNLIWKSNTKIVNYEQEKAINVMQESFSQIFKTAQPVIERAIGSSTEIIDQINSASSSFSTTSSVVE